MLGKSLFGNGSSFGGSGETKSCGEMRLEDGKLYYEPLPDVLIEDGKVYFTETGTNADLSLIDGKVYVEEVV